MSNWDFLKKKIKRKKKSYALGRWIFLYDKDGNLKAESSSEDLLQFYEEGDIIKHEYYRTEYKYVDVTEEFLKNFSVEDWKFDDEDCD